MTSTLPATALSSRSLLFPGRVELDRDLRAIITSLSEQERSTKSMLFPEISELDQDLRTIFASIQDPKGKLITTERSPKSAAEKESRPNLQMLAFDERKSVDDQHLKYHFDPDELQAIKIYSNGQISPNTKRTFG